MFLLGFYRLYFSMVAGFVAYFFVVPVWWVVLVVSVVVRFVWLFVERTIKDCIVNRQFTAHSYRFKQELGPYGIRLVNRAEKDILVKRSLSEVFTENVRSLRKTVEELEMMDSLFSAGMRPDGDTYLLHDCKLKYGRHRLEQLNK